MSSSTDCAFTLQPLAVSETSPLMSLPNINYTNQDFSSMKTRLISYIQENFTTDFTDFVEGDLGIMLIENWAFIADTLSFKDDQIVNEIFIDTVTEIDNAFRLCNLIGFMPTPPIAASAMFSATIQSPLVTDLIIPGGLQLAVTSSGSPLTYELFPADANLNPIFNQDIIIPSGNTTNTSIVGLAGTTVNDTFSSAGGINQNYTLNSSPVLYGSVSLTVDGQTWNLVPYFTDSKGRNEYRVEFDSNWVGYIIFGNGSAGRAPTVGSAIVITYRIGGGISGNIITGFIQSARGFSVPGLGFSVPVAFNNYTAGQYGYDGDTLDDIRIELPQYVATQNRAVTGSDYQTLTDQFASVYNGQVGKSLAALRNYGCAGNIVDLYILALSGVNDLVVASDQLKAELSTYISTVQMLTDYVCIRDGVVILVDLILDVVADKSYIKFSSEILTNINNKLNDFFALNNWEYGESLADTDIYRILAGMRQILDVTVSFTTSDPNNGGSMVTTQFYEIIRNDVTSINLTFE